MKSGKFRQDKIKIRVRQIKREKISLLNQIREFIARFYIARSLVSWSVEEALSTARS